MRKLLRKQDILFLGLAGLLDIFEEFRDPGGLVGKSYESMYGFMPSKFERKQFQHLVWRNLKTEHIEKVIENGEAYLCLTSEGKNKVKRNFPLISFQKKKWDEKWRFIFFDIEEINRLKRDVFREKLKELGFGMLQKSVFISPHDFVKDLLEFLKDYGLSNHIYVIEIPNSNILMGDIKGLVKKIWNLDKLNERYKNIIERLKNNGVTIDNDRGQKLNQEGESFQKNKKDNINEIYQNYFNILVQDPFLPKELLPGDWARERAGSMFKKYARIKDKREG